MKTLTFLIASFALSIPSAGCTADSDTVPGPAENEGSRTEDDGTSSAITVPAPAEYPEAISVDLATLVTGSVDA